MYPENQIEKAQACGQLSISAVHNPTVGENLEMRIKMLKEELARLEASRETLKPLLEMRIRDIRDAMNY